MILTILLIALLVYLSFGTWIVLTANYPYGLKLLKQPRTYWYILIWPKHVMDVLGDKG